MPQQHGILGEIRILKRHGRVSKYGKDPGQHAQSVCIDLFLMQMRISLSNLCLVPCQIFNYLSRTGLVLQWTTLMVMSMGTLIWIHSTFFCFRRCNLLVVYVHGSIPGFLFLSRSALSSATCQRVSCTWHELARDRGAGAIYVRKDHAECYRQSRASTSFNSSDAVVRTPTRRCIVSYDGDERDGEKQPPRAHHWSPPSQAAQAMGHPPPLVPLFACVRHPHPSVALERPVCAHPVARDANSSALQEPEAHAGSAADVQQSHSIGPLRARDEVDVAEERDDMDRRRDRTGDSEGGFAVKEWPDQSTWPCRARFA